VRPLLFALFFVSTISLHGQKLNWVKFPPPQYPRNAQIAHIEGPVTLKFTLQPENAVSVKESTGHPLLIPAAIESLKTSQLECVDCERLAPGFTVAFDFRVESHDCRDSGLPTQAKIDSPMHVTVVAQAICTSDPTARYVRTRSFRCLFLWKCAMHPE
jgi:hypothetical protein